MPLGCQKKLSKEICVIVVVPLGYIGIQNAEHFEKDFVAHTVPLVFVANLFIKSSHNSVCPMSRLNLATFRIFSVFCWMPL